jgi:hypothetical protein
MKLTEIDVLMYKKLLGKGNLSANDKKYIESIVGSHQVSGENFHECKNRLEWNRYGLAQSLDVCFY